MLSSDSLSSDLWQFPGFPQGPLEFSTQLSRRSRGPFIVHCLDGPVAKVRTWIDHIPVTNAGRTLLDVAGSAPADVLEEALEDAIRRRLTTLAHLRWLMRDRTGRGAKGIRNLRALVDDVGSQPQVTASTFETKLFRVLREAALPLPVKQLEVWDGSEFVARPDFAYPHARVAIEADSYRFHSGRVAWDKNVDRRTDLTAIGWRVLNITWRRLEKRPGEVVKRIRQALGMSLFE